MQKVCNDWLIMCLISASFNNKHKSVDVTQISIMSQTNKAELGMSEASLKTWTLLLIGSQTSDGCLMLLVVTCFGLLAPAWLATVAKFCKKTTRRNPAYHIP